MSQRLEFCMLASKPESNLSDLYRRFNITRRTGYKWLQRNLDEGILGLEDKSKRPDNFPNQVATYIDQYVVTL
ncbi:MAG: helix-turn-helix domain-containing protein [Bacteroidales bacterium]